MQLELFVYSVPLHPPLAKREGLLIRVALDDQHLFAEASPLPGWSKESLDDVIKESKTLFDHPDVTVLDLEKALLHTQLPSLQFALESLLFQIQKESLMSQLLEVQGIRLRDELVSEELLSQFSTWKVKIRSLSEWLEIAPQFSSVPMIRLDANQSLKASDVTLLHACKHPIEYIEEPGEEFHLELEKSPKSGSIYFALDETLRNRTSFPRLAHHEQCAAYIIKPTLHGKRSQYEKFCLKASELWKDFILGSSFESPIGLYQIACLQETFPCTTPWGLGTYRYFPTDFCLPFPKIIEKGLIEFAPISRVNTKYLRKLL